MRTQKEVVEKILECVKEEPMSFMRLCRESGFNYRTVRKTLQLIEILQHEDNKVDIMRDGFRVVIRKSE